MTNLTESAVWESGVYQIETGDYLLGGANGTLNVQPKQLANRTRYLKAITDEVIAARGSSGTLGDRLSGVENNVAGLDPDMQNAQVAALKFALTAAAHANYSVRALKQQIQQEGEITISNRGVVSGCSITKSTTAARNLSIAAGKCFANGRVYSVADGVNAASVPPNTGSGSVVVYAYLYQGVDMLWRLAVTAIGQAVPDGAIRIYNVTIPAGSTDATDPNLTNVTLTDVRRIEASFPSLLDNPASASIAINTLAANDYRVDFDVVSAVGGPCPREAITVASRATNGLTLELASAADSVRVRYRVSKLNN